MQIADKTLDEWIKFAREDTCLDRMVPSDLRQLVSELARVRNERDDLVSFLSGIARQTENMALSYENR